MVVQAQIQRKVPFNGIVLDINEEPVKKARVYLNNSRKFAVTDYRGAFGLIDVQPDDTICILIRKTKQLYKVPVVGNRSMRIILTSETEALAEEDEELIKAGFDFVRRRSGVGNSEGIIVTGEALRRTGRRDLLSALSGKVAGLNITQSDIPGSEATVNIRGIKSFHAPSTPLYIYDGMVIDNFNFVSLDDVDYVEVLKDGGMYGSRGANGVIAVYSKKE